MQTVWMSLLSEFGPKLPLVVLGLTTIRLTRSKRDQERRHAHTLEQLAEARNRFFTDNPDPVIVATHTPTAVGRILQASASADELLGTRLAGRLLEDFVDRELLDILAVSMGSTERQASIGQVAEGIPITTAAGSTMTIDASIQPITTEEGPRLVIAIRDAAERLGALDAGVAAAQRDQAQQILTATHHQLSREIVLVGMEIDDIRDSGADTSTLEAAYDRLEMERDGVVALTELSVEERTTIAVNATADILAPRLEGARMAITTNAELEGVNPRLLRLSLRELVLAAGSAGASDFGVVTESKCLVLSWTGGPDLTWDSSDRLEVGAIDPFPITRRVTAAHGAGCQVGRCEDRWRAEFVFTSLSESFEPLASV